ncbi:dihydroxy-acid dehydratase [Caulobacter sp.]|uniref:dihydroxy-acid dehydratase domain-containing protein n=1 Tax=Caulobacter sp. TaxID=78 RepID=UPI003BB19A3C
MRPQGLSGHAGSGQHAPADQAAGEGRQDMVRTSDARISDARISGTAFGTIILHVSPESDVGGPLAVARLRQTPHRPGAAGRQGLRPGRPSRAQRLSRHAGAPLT